MTIIASYYPSGGKRRRPRKSAEERIVEKTEMPFKGVYYDWEGRLHCEKCEVPLQFRGASESGFGAETAWYCRSHFEHFYITALAATRITHKAGAPVPCDDGSPDASARRFAEHLMAAVRHADDDVA